MQPRTPDEVLKLVKDEGIEFIDYRFCDLPGLMQHVSDDILRRPGNEESMAAVPREKAKRDLSCGVRAEAIHLADEKQILIERDLRVFPNVSHTGIS